jgi:hypothetical protein
MNKYTKLWALTRAEIPGVRIVLREDSRFMRLVFFLLTWLVRIFTFGKGRAEWDGFTTTIWRTLYVPNDFDEWTSYQKYSLLRHELRHLRQFRYWPIRRLGVRGWWRINAVLMSISYLLLPLPVFFTLRAKFERQGYTETALVRYETYGFSKDYKQSFIKWMGDTFGGSSYFFMWRRKAAERWAEKTLGKIERGEIKNLRDAV